MHFSWWPWRLAASIQDDGAGLQGRQQNCSHLPPNIVQTWCPTRALCSATSAGWLVPPSLRANKGCSEKSRLFSVLVPQWWNELLTSVRTAESFLPSTSPHQHSFSSAKDSRLICSDFNLDPAYHDKMSQWQLSFQSAKSTPAGSKWECHFEP